VGRGSIAVASVGAGFLALMIGFLIGFAGSRWLVNKKNLAKTAATNAELATSRKEQSERLTDKKSIDFPPNVNSWNERVDKDPGKDYPRADTLEKTAKKIYI